MLQMYQQLVVSTKTSHSTNRNFFYKKMGPATGPILLILHMNKLKYYFCCLLIGISGEVFSQDFTIGSVTSYPFPSELTASKTGSKFALAINEKGKRNIYVWEGPAFALKKI